MKLTGKCLFRTCGQDRFGIAIGDGLLLVRGDMLNERMHALGQQTAIQGCEEFLYRLLLLAISQVETQRA